ncbi:AraC family transcriptional regulator [Mucilaginibacter rubeus]|uniref:AraC family transcriptional regulator n=1 Tax=Mucilaginibacter rubeus TaxID=2027860 RepID=A0AAE6JL32_9SPHI|nr:MULTISPECIES: helix-turn-helix domain-containing protein [Mucilaginibacter]QEM07525.1 AraC family transcriptional regulator [Mucilaginibacter rubeus]QEM19979.1 AraC family transcriptional regulator [Mucilaginibacter gossypii]QTE43313.1 AraC family transcriptional regulator [Mucilaginibacter rubeus]QTE49913.1 AraC family transcriptional regulator [Mucilaginibacter rubeus]QTE55004.1 AraC family transcriptional regulator [Mucilaginibacter rubeus]
MSNELIPTIKLDEVIELGLQVVDYRKAGDLHFLKSPHRNEHYLFVLVTDGNLKLVVDSRGMVIPAQSVYYILPGQVMQHFDTEADAYVIAVDAFLLNQTYKFILDEGCFVQTPVAINAERGGRLKSAISLLGAEVKDASVNSCKEHIKRGLIDAVAGMFAGEYVDSTIAHGRKDSSAVRITTAFKRLIFAEYKTLKKPSSYASALNISTPYLNEAVKEISGQTVSYWIQNMIMFEAKRLLIYTDKTIKAIAYELGYADYVYFSKMFIGMVKMSPGAFRKKYR